MANSHPLKLKNMKALDDFIKRKQIRDAEASEHHRYYDASFACVNFALSQDYINYYKKFK